MVKSKKTTVLKVQNPCGLFCFYLRPTKYKDFEFNTIYSRLINGRKIQMNLRDYVSERMEQENNLIKNRSLRFEMPSSPDEIVELYQTYAGMKRHMRALGPEKVQEYLDRGFAFVGAYYDRELAGIAVSKQLPEDYPYFTLPKDEERGNIYTLGGLYVRDDFQGLGIASKLSRIVTKGTEDFGRATKEAVGMAYEVSYDNYGSLKILSQQGNYVGFYADTPSEEGLTILLYRPFVNEAVRVDQPSIQLTQDADTSLINLTNGLEYISQQEQIGGLTETQQLQDNGAMVKTLVLNKTPHTIPDPTFEMVK